MEGSRSAILGLEIDGVGHVSRPNPSIPQATVCPKGHDLTPDNVYRRKSGRLYCRRCSIDRAKEWRRQNVERARELTSRSHRKLRAAGDWRTADQRMFRLYGLTRAAYEAMLSAQGHRCPLCSVAFSYERQLDKALRPRMLRNSPVVDHCHVTGTVRGVICMLCNRGLGDFKDSASALRAAAEYLERIGT